MSQKNNNTNTARHSIPHERGIYDAIAQSPRGINFHTLRDLFDADTHEDKKALKESLSAMKESGRLSYDSASKRYFAATPIAPVMVVRAKVSDRGIELYPVKWKGTDISKPALMVKKSDPEYGQIKNGDKLLIAIQSNIVMHGPHGTRQLVGNCTVVQRLPLQSPASIKAIFTQEAHGGHTLSPAFRTAKGAKVHIQTLDFRGAYKKDDYPNKSRVLVRLSEKNSQHILSGIVMDLAEWDKKHSASLLSKRDKVNAFFEDNIYSPALEEKARQIALIAPEPKDYEDMRGVIQFAVDPEDAKDRDDAISARPDADPANPGGYYITVSNIDVTRLVSQMPEVIENALRHPLSAYTNDAAIHMLPKTWAEDAASLQDGKDRFCMSVEIRIDYQGEMLDTRVFRSLNSPHVVSYNTFDRALIEGDVPDFTPDMTEAAHNILNAYEALVLEDSNRQALNFKQARYYIEKDEHDRIKGVKSEAEAGAISRDIIKKFMGFSNLITRGLCGEMGANTIDRVESEPNIHTRLPKNITSANKEAQYLNRIWTRDEIQSELDKYATDPAMEQAISDLLIRRVMRPGRFTTTEVGHFGMGLTDRPYASFSTGVRSLDSLVNQMSIYEAKGWLEEYCDQERIEWLHEKLLSPQAQMNIAEFMNDQQPIYKRLQREAMRRQAIAHLHQYEGQTVSACFQHVTDNEMSLKLEDCARPFLLPLAALSGATFISDVKKQQLIDRTTGRIVRAQEWMELKLQIADPLSNRLLLSIPETQPSIEVTPPQKQKETAQSIVYRALVLEATTKTVRIQIGDKEIDLSNKFPGSRTQRPDGLYHYNTGITLTPGEKQNFKFTLDAQGKIAAAIPTNQKRLEPGKAYDSFFDAHDITFERSEHKRVAKRPWQQGLGGLATLLAHSSSAPEIAAE